MALPGKKESGPVKKAKDQSAGFPCEPLRCSSSDPLLAAMELKLSRLISLIGHGCLLLDTLRLCRTFQVWGKFQHRNFLAWFVVELFKL